MKKHIIIFILIIASIIVSAIDYSILYKSGSPEEIEQELLRGRNVNEQLNNGLTPFLFVAAYNDNPEILKILIKYGANFKARDLKGRNALHLAAIYNSNEKVLEAIINFGFDLDPIDLSGYTPLLYAAMYNQNPEVVKTLIKYGAFINKRGPDKKTALMNAVYGNKNPLVADELIKQGINIRMLDLDLRDAFYFSNASFRKTDIFKTLTTLLNKNYYDFGQFTWGMSRNEVSLIENPRLNIYGSYAGNGWFYYDDVLAYNEPCNLGYRFTPDDKLFTIFYNFKLYYENIYKYLEFFNSIKEDMKKKYGEPIIDRIKGAESDLSDPAAALMKGKVTIYTQFYCGRTSVYMSMESTGTIPKFTILVEDLFNQFKYETAQ